MLFTVIITSTFVKLTIVCVTTPDVTVIIAIRDRSCDHLVKL